jgi:hypothetical protein
LDSSKQAESGDNDESETSKPSFLFFHSFSSGRYVIDYNCINHIILSFVTIFCSFPDFHTISSTQAMLLPLGASCSLLFMFFFFEKFQSIFALCTVGMC